MSISCSTSLSCAEKDLASIAGKKTKLSSPEISSPKGGRSVRESVALVFSEVQSSSSSARMPEDVRPVHVKKLYSELCESNQKEKQERILAKAKDMGASAMQLSLLKDALVSSPSLLKLLPKPKEFAEQVKEKLIELAKNRKGVRTKELEKEIRDPRVLKMLQKLAESVKHYDIEPLQHSHVDEDEGEMVVSQYDDGEDVPVHIIEWDTSKEHTLNVDKYLDVRLSRTLVKTMKKFEKSGKNLEVFIGPTKDLGKYYAAKGYHAVAQLKTNNSNKYFVFADEHDRNHKLVIAGISNKSRLHNVLLQLKFLDINLAERVAIRGDLVSAVQANLLEVNKGLVGCHRNGVVPVLAFIGNRSIVFTELAKYLYPKEMGLIEGEERQEKEAERLLSEHNGFTTVDADKVFKYSYATVSIGGRPGSIVAFRMPNGSLSYPATRSIFNHGFTHFVMVGAGGSLDEDRGGGLGAYQLIASASYLDQTKTMPQDRCLPVEQMKLSGLELRVQGSNVTVDGPLEEDVEWHEQVKRDKLTAVDVETFHIFQGIEDSIPGHSKGDQVRVSPGLFNSDVVGKHPLEDKITGENAYSGFPILLKALFDYEQVEVLE